MRVIYLGEYGYTASVSAPTWHIKVRVRRTNGPDYSDNGNEVLGLEVRNLRTSSPKNPDNSWNFSKRMLKSVLAVLFGAGW